MTLENRTPSLPIAVIDNPLLSRLVSLGIAAFLPQIFRYIRIPPEVKLEAEVSPNKVALFDLLDSSRDFFIDCFEADITNKEFLKTILGAGEAAAIAQAEITYSIVL